MAYDPRAPYPPPTRGYYGGDQQPPAPAQHSYRAPAQEQHGGYGHAGYAPANDARHQQYGGQDQYRGQDVGHFQRQMPNNEYHEEYHENYQQYQQTPISGDQQYERSYEPRYQQRAPKGGQQQEYRQPPFERQGYHAQPDYPRRPIDSRNGQFSPPGSAQQKPETFEQIPDPMSRPRTQGSGIVAKPQLQPLQPLDPKKMTMEQWKAAERAKLHATQSPETVAQDNAFPVFPKKKDPIKAGSDRSGSANATSHRSSEEAGRPSTSSSHKQSERPPLPRDSSYNRNNSPLQSAQPVPRNRTDSFEQVADQQTNERAAQSRPQQQADRPVTERQSSRQRQEVRPQYDRTPSEQPSNHSGSSMYDSQPSQWPINSRRPSLGQQMSTGPGQPPSRPQYDRKSSGKPSSSNGPGTPAHEHQPHPWPEATTRNTGQSTPNPSSITQSQLHDDGYTPQSAGAIYAPHQEPDYFPQQQQQPDPAQQRSRPGTATRRKPPIQAIDTEQALDFQKPAYSDHHPLSPAYLPRRPGTAQASFSPAASLQTNSPLGQQQHPRAASSLQKVHQSHQNLEELYDDYGDNNAAAPVKTREEEIEAEMPDFDSAAPSQKSQLHKRTQTVDRHLAEASPLSATSPPPMPAISSTYTAPLNRPNVHSLPAHETRPMYAQEGPSFQRASDPYHAMAAQNETSALGNGTAFANDAAVNDVGGFDFGVPAHQPFGNPQDENGRLNSPQSPHYEQQVHPVVWPLDAPPSAPFAQEQPVRRSMDDAQQMAYRNGPPRGPTRGPPHGPMSSHAQSQRYYSNGQRFGGSGALPGPEAGRSFSPPTMVSAYNGQQRMGSAPPLRQGLQEPPGRSPPNGGPHGAPLSQQRSAPEQQQAVQGNPDALPRHPVPVRPGLMEGSTLQPARPPPVRNYDNVSVSSAPSQPPQASVDRSLQPVTREELNQLGAAVTANPGNNRQALLFAKKLVEASTVLASEGGRADPKTAARNREKYIMDAYKRIKKLVSIGYPEAQFYLADAYGQGALGLEVDTKEAFNLYQAAAKQGHAQAAYRTAVCCEIGPDEGGGTRKDVAKAVQWYRRASALGDVAAMFKLGMILLKGLLGQQRSVGEAASWLKRAGERADQDNPHALHELGLLYEPSNTNPEVRNKIIADEGYARELFQQAAEMGYKFSQFRLGQAYEYGNLGLPIDNRASIKWYSKAAAQGEHQAELALSGWYLTGADGILEHSDTEAYLWARKAARAEPPLAKAMFAMGYFSEQGIGCPVDVEEARKWYGRAASYKFPKALERLEELKKGGKGRPGPASGRLMRKDQKKDEQECVMM